MVVVGKGDESTLSQKGNAARGGCAYLILKSKRDGRAGSHFARFCPLSATLMLPLMRFLTSKDF